MRQGKVDSPAQVASRDLAVDRVHARGTDLDLDIVRAGLRSRYIREAQRLDAVETGERERLHVVTPGNLYAWPRNISRASTMRMTSPGPSVSMKLRASRHICAIGISAASPMAP